VLQLGPQGALFLDRDGTINVKAAEGEYITAPAAFELLPGAAAAIRRANDSGTPVILITNQRGIALGRMTHDDLVRVHETMARALDSEAGAHVDAIYYCPHNTGECACRKPAPGLVLEALGDFPDVLPNESVMVGDSVVDEMAATASGVPSILLGTAVSSLAEAVDLLLPHRQ
jgi:D-glycero-D-manno-heptose 1,7-bisphosphate phosphatase